EREEGVDADAEHVRLRLIELRHRVAERAQLLLADRAERRWKKCEHHRMTSLGAQRHRLSLLIHEREVRRFRSDLCSHASPQWRTRSAERRVAATGRASSAPTNFTVVRIGFWVGPTKRARPVRTITVY